MTFALVSLLGACGNDGAELRLGGAAPKAGFAVPTDAAAEDRRGQSATVAMGAFEIPPGGELFRCQSFANPFGRDVAVTRAESFMTAGSHHLFVFLSRVSQDGPLRQCSGLDFGNYLHLSQRPHEAFAYPPGVGRLLPADEGITLQVHYLNSSAQSLRAEVAVTLRAQEPEQVPIRASQVFINTWNINVPPASAGTAGTSCAVPKDIELFSAVSHMHQYGVHFTARDTSGQLLYETNDWAHPGPWSFTPPRRLLAGSRIDIHCEYQNHSTKTLTFGESAANNEMCIFAGGYYPAAPDDEITCLY